MINEEKKKRAIRRSLKYNPEAKGVAVDATTMVLLSIKDLQSKSYYYEPSLDRKKQKEKKEMPNTEKQTKEPTIEEFKKELLDEIHYMNRSLRDAIVEQIKYVKASELKADQPRITVKASYERKAGCITELIVSIPLSHTLTESEILDRLDQLHAKLTHKAQLSEEAFHSYEEEKTQEQTVKQTVVINGLPKDWPYCPECKIPLKASQPSEKFPQYGNWWKCGEHKLTSAERKIAMNMSGRKTSKPTDQEVKISWEVLG